MEDNKNLSEQTTEIDEAKATNKAAKAVDNGASENSDASNKENVNEVEFTDSKKPEETPAKEEETNKTTEEPKKTQDNSENARRRREAERQAELKKTRYDAIKEAVDGINPYTNKAIVDDLDVEEYLAMKEIKKSGGDPVADYSEHIKTKQKEQAQVELKKAEEEEWFENDYRDFKTKHPEVDLEELGKDEAFRLFAEDKVGKTPMSEIYDKYQSIVNKAKQEQESTRIRQEANKKATPGALSSVEQSSSDYYTPEEVKKMSQEEVSKNFDKIKKSMQKWK